MACGLKMMTMVSLALSSQQRTEDHDVMVHKAKTRSRQQQQCITAENNREEKKKRERKKEVVEEPKKKKKRDQRQ